MTSKIMILIAITFSSLALPVSGQELLSAESASASKPSLQELFTNGVNICPECFEDVRKNDRRRRGNFFHAYPDITDRLLRIVQFVNIPRPQVENDVLVGRGRRLLQVSPSKRDYSKIGAVFLESSMFCSQDARIWRLGKAFVEQSDHVSTEKFLWVSFDALKCIGMVRAPGLAEYLTAAATETYWREVIPADSEIQLQDADVFTLRTSALRGILNLPCDESIPIFEKLLPELPEDDRVRNWVRRYLDEAWRRKKNELPVDKYLLRYVYPPVPKAEYYTHTRYPEWIYGPGGEKIAWPFGKPPEGYEPPTGHFVF